MADPRRRLTVNGGRLRERRETLRLRQIDVAAETDVTPARLRQLERGGQNARLTTLGRLADALQLEPSDLLEWAEAPDR